MFIYIYIHIYMTYHISRMLVHVNLLRRRILSPSCSNRPAHTASLKSLNQPGLDGRGTQSRSHHVEAWQMGPLFQATFLEHPSKVVEDKVGIPSFTVYKRWWKLQWLVEMGGEKIVGSDTWTWNIQYITIQMFNQCLVIGGWCFSSRDVFESVKMAESPPF